MTEEDVLDALYEAAFREADFTMDFWGSRPDLPRAEMYVEINGECWRILAEPHPHPED